VIFLIMHHGSAPSDVPWNVTFPRTDDATGFHCTMHGKFKVTDTIVLDGYTRQRWEVAPKKAQLRTKVFLRRFALGIGVNSFLLGYCQNRRHDTVNFKLR